jgi:hypothetical protein
LACFIISMRFFMAVLSDLKHQTEKWEPLFGQI